MTAPCGATTRDVHGYAVCDLDAGHRGGHSGEVMAGIYLSWEAAPPLSPREREIVDRFEAAPDLFLPACGDCDCGGCPTPDDFAEHELQQWHAAGEIAYGSLGLRYPGGA